MTITVLVVAGCPNLPLMTSRLAEALTDQPGIQVTRQVITSPDEAARTGMHGSPTVLIDGIDPFAEPGQQPSMSCRLYRDDEGLITPAPSANQLRHALEVAAAEARPIAGTA